MKIKKINSKFIILSLMLFLVGGCLIGCQKQKEPVKKTQEGENEEPQILSWTYCPLPGCGTRDVKDTLEQMQQTLHLEIEEESQSYQWKEVSIGDVKGSAVLWFGEDDRLTKAEYTFESNDQVKLLTSLIAQYGTAIQNQEGEETAAWLLRMYDGSNFQMIFETKEGMLKLYLLDESMQKDSSWNYPIPDMYNTGYFSEKENLKDFKEKYPECVLEDGRIAITEKSAKLYDYHFEGFQCEEKISFLNLQHSVLMENFYVKGNITIDYKNSNSNVMVNLRNGEVDSGMIRAYNIVLDRIYMHDSPSDFINALYQVTIRDCYFRDGGTSPEAHADGIQIAGYDNVDADKIEMENVRIDMPYISGHHVANACVMIQPDYGAVKGVTLKHCYLNGGGFTIYSFPKKNTIENVYLEDTVIGYGAKYGVYYKDSQENMTEENTLMAERPYVGSVIGKEDSIQYYLNNYSENSHKIAGKITVLKSGEMKESISFENEIERYLPYEEYENSEEYPNQPVDRSYKVQLKEGDSELALVSFYYQQKFIGGYYILMEQEENQ
ncbi:hypothetical protein NDGK_03078 [Clostridiales bacterium CHKCI001]|nr:hypothetical protein NDGK_03078 [Clostridiales bacterium CHKCI001]